MKKRGYLIKMKIEKSNECINYIFENKDLYEEYKSGFVTVFQAIICYGIDDVEKNLQI